MRKRITIGAGGLLLGLVVLESVARFALGLGDPPLYTAHPSIEYMLRPDGVYRRFGNRFEVNHYGMRSGEMSAQKRVDEVRLLVLGDSVPNGGGLTDQAELATEIVRHELAAKLGRGVTVGNISAGTWSPPNLLAYIKEYGTFEADVAVIVLNKGDLNDLPTFAPLDPNVHPTRRPLTATGELLNRYLLGRLRSMKHRSAAPKPTSYVESDAPCLGALQEVVEMLRREGCSVILLYHPSRDEFDARGDFCPDAVHATLRMFATRHDIPFVSLAARYEAAVRGGRPLFRDTFHPAALGQALMAEEIMAALDRDGWVQRWKGGRDDGH